MAAQNGLYLAWLETPEDTFCHVVAHVYLAAAMIQWSRALTTTIMILSIRTDRSGQTVQTQIRLFLEAQSDQGLHCLQFRLHLLDALVFGKAILFKF